MDHFMVQGFNGELALGHDPRIDDRMQMHGQLCARRDRNAEDGHLRLALRISRQRCAVSAGGCLEQRFNNNAVAVGCKGRGRANEKQTDSKNNFLHDFNRSAP